jgi:hypothetical protein
MKKKVTLYDVGYALVTFSGSIIAASEFIPDQVKIPVLVRSVAVITGAIGGGILYIDKKLKSKKKNEN